MKCSILWIQEFSGHAIVATQEIGVRFLALAIETKLDLRLPLVVELCRLIGYHIHPLSFGSWPVSAWNAFAAA